MFFKHVCILFAVLCILGYVFGDYIFYRQAQFMIYQQYTIPAYEAYERLIRYYPNSKYAKEARKEMVRLRSSNADLNKYLEKNESKYMKTQKEKEKIESYR